MEKLRENLGNVSFGTVSFDTLPVYDGIKLPGFPELMADTEKKMTAIREFKSQETDILICAYPKSGTHWMSEIVEELIAGKAEYSEKSKGGLFMEAENIEEFEATECPPPRNLNTHLPFRMLPKKHIELNAKIIHVIRNPKDVTVSLFHHTRRSPFGEFKGFSWTGFFKERTQSNNS